jgi:ribosomal protein S18 acetylase RimI-like enzyme
MSEPPGSNIVIRPATAADVPHLGRLGASLVETHHAFDPQRFFASTAGTPAGYGGFLRSQLQEADAIVLVADDNGAVVGYTYATVEGTDFLALRGPAGVLHDILVDPACRGRGVGRMLLNAALSSLKEKGAPRVVLFTAERNAAAQRLFAAIGFRRTMVEMTREFDESVGT